MSERPTIAAVQRDVDRVDAKVNQHEAECALRYQQITGQLADFKVTLDSNHRRSGRVEVAAWGVLVSLITILLGMLFRGEIGS